MQRTFSLILAFIMVLSLFASFDLTDPAFADLSEDLDSDIKLSTEFFPSFTAGMESSQEYTISDWLEDDDTRALLAVCLLSDVVSEEDALHNYFNTDNLISDGYISKYEKDKIILNIWTQERTLTVTYAPDTGSGSYFVSPSTRDEILNMIELHDSPYWTINSDSIDTAMLYTATVESAASSDGNSETLPKYPHKDREPSSFHEKPDSLDQSSSSQESGSASNSSRAPGSISLNFGDNRYSAGYWSVPVLEPEEEIQNCKEFTLCFCYDAVNSKQLGDQRVYVCINQYNSAWVDCGIMSVLEEGEVYRKTITLDKPRMIAGIAVLSKTATEDSFWATAWIEDVK